MRVDGGDKGTTWDRLLTSDGGQLTIKEIVLVDGDDQLGR